MKIHASGEDYLEAILVLQKKMGMVRSIDLARHMGFSKPSISHAVRMGQRSQPFGTVRWRDIRPHQRQIWRCAVISPFGQDGMLPRWTLCSGSRD